MSQIHYCVCGNIYNITDDITKYTTNQKYVKFMPYFYCNNCSNIQEIEPGTIINVSGGVEQSVYIPKENINKIKNKKLNKSLLRTKNYICQNKDCPTHQNPKTKEAIIEHVSHDSFIVKYICCVCNCYWLNR